MLDKVEGKKDKDKLPISNKKVKNLTSTSTKIRIKNVLKPKVQKTTSTDIVSSPKKHVETLLENNIVIPKHDFTSLKSNETFDDFILFKQKYMNHPDNSKNKFLSPKMTIFY